jgi:hypothetical protein
MDRDQEQEILRLMRAAREKARGYADHFGWATDRDLEEWGIITCLNEALEKSHNLSFSSIKVRGRGNDPPDCEAIFDNHGQAALEVTELVSEGAVKAFKAGHTYVWADWDREAFHSSITNLIERKNKRYPALKGGPYPAGYFLVIFSDEPLLNKKVVSEYLESYTAPVAENLLKIYFLISYDPAIETYPYFEIR